MIIKLFYLAELLVKTELSIFSVTIFPYKIEHSVPIFDKN